MLDRNSKPQMEEDSPLEETKSKLYSKYYSPVQKRASLNQKRYQVKNDWDDEKLNVGQEIIPNNSEEFYWGPGAEINQFEEMSKKPNPKPRKTKSNVLNLFMIVAGLFFVASLGYALFVFTRSQDNLVHDVNIQVISPISVGGGETLNFDVIIENNNQIPLELVDLVIRYPEGSKSSSDLMTDIRTARFDLGNIEPNQIVRKSVQAALFGEENTKKEIDVFIEYRLQGSNAIFEKEKPFQVTLSSAPVRLVVDALDNISSGQTLSINTKLSSNSTDVLENIMVIAKYPFGFEFESASIKPSVNDNIWFFSKLNPKEEKEIVIKGKVNGQDSEVRSFRFQTGIKSDQSNEALAVVWSETFHSATILQSFLDLKLTLNMEDSADIVVSSEELVSGNISFVNGTEDILRNIEMEVFFEGEVLNKNSVDVDQGFYDSIKNTIFWDKNSFRKLTELEPGEMINLSFGFSSKNIGNLNTNLSNPKINLNTKIRADRISSDNSETALNRESFASVSIISDVPASIQTAFSEGVPINNFGPMPPVAEQETNYTLIFQVANSTNKIKDVKMEARLPLYVKWDNIFIPSSETITYDEQTRTVTWYIGDMEPGVGYGKESRKMYAQVTLTPSVSQKGSIPKLLNNVVLTGYDTFVQLDFVQKLESPTTKIFNATTYDNHAVVR